MKFYLTDYNYRRIAEVLEGSPFVLDYMNPKELIPIEEDQSSTTVYSILDLIVENRGWPEDLPPISVTFDDDVNGYVILNGHHRWQASLKYGLDEVPVRVFRSDPEFVDWYLKYEEE